MSGGWVLMAQGVGRKGVEVEVELRRLTRKRNRSSSVQQDDARSRCRISAVWRHGIGGVVVVSVVVVGLKSRDGGIRFQCRRKRRHP